MTTKKLIEVALPLDAINKASAREKSIRHGHPSTLHLWWARRPLAAARAVIFAQMVDDPSAHPDLFPTEKAQEKERQRLFKIIEDLVQWENTTNEKVLQKARDEIWQSWRYTCAANADHPRAKELFDRHKLPAFHDPFAGGGSIPLEAQRLGLEAYASDLNPVAVLINKAMIEIPPKFAGMPPVNPEARRDRRLFSKQWKGAEGLAEDVRYYGKWMRDEAEKQIGHLYPKVEITAEMANERPDLNPLVGQRLTVIAWIWARTVKSPNPAFADVEVPLASTFMLSTKPGRETYVLPVIEGDQYRFTVRVGQPKDAEAAKSGTKLSRGANFKCVLSGAPIEGEYIKSEGRAGRIGVRLMSIVGEGDHGRVYLAPTPEHEAAARTVRPEWRPELTICGSTQYLGVKPYGMHRFDQLFLDRQLAALGTLSDLAKEALERIHQDGLTAKLNGDQEHLSGCGVGAFAYAEAVVTYLSLSVNNLLDDLTTLATWRTGHGTGALGHAFSRQAIAMTWDFPEASPFSGAAGDLANSVDAVARCLLSLPPSSPSGRASQLDAAEQVMSADRLVSTDPPYYDNVPYADLSDYFYIWLRRSLAGVFPETLATLAVPKALELVAFAHSHGSKEKAEAFFLDGMTKAMHRLATLAHPGFPVAIYYAFKQAESEINVGVASTGWETFLEAVIRAGFAVGGTWPIRTEREVRSRGIGSNALASSIVLVCRPRATDSPAAARRDFVSALKAELPGALAHLQRGNIAPVDLAQAAIGPGMAVFTRFSKVLDAQGNPLSVREALALINQVLDEVLGEQESDFDADSRWALAWFEHAGFAEAEYGVAETLSKAKNTSVAGLVEAGFLKSSLGKVRLLKPHELAPDWDPDSDRRLTVWETVHQLVRALEKGGDLAAAALVAKLGSKAETARELSYRLYTICERKKRAAEALSYNALVQSWPEITRLAREGPKSAERVEPLRFGDDES
jgi:putative DNA methylase